MHLRFGPPSYRPAVDVELVATLGWGPSRAPRHPPQRPSKPARFKRDADFLSTTPYDGGAKYNEDVCINNWVQERRDKNYKSGAVQRNGLVPKALAWMPRGWAHPLTCIGFGGRLHMETGFTHQLPTRRA